MVAAHRGQGRRARARRTSGSATPASDPEWRAVRRSRSCGSTTISSSRPARAARAPAPLPARVVRRRAAGVGGTPVGRHRPGWGRLVERYGERPQLLASDVVACVSDEVAREVRPPRRPRDRIVVSPTAVDAERSRRPRRTRGADTRSGSATRSSSGGRARSAGSRDSRPWSTAFGALRRDGTAARLLLVGDGAERPHVERLVDQAGRARRSSSPARSCRGTCPRTSTRWTWRWCRRARTRASTTRRSSSASTWRADARCSRPASARFPVSSTTGARAPLEPGDVDDLAVKLAGSPTIRASALASAPPDVSSCSPPNMGRAVRQSCSTLRRSALRWKGSRSA